MTEGYSFLFAFLCGAATGAVAVLAWNPLCRWADGTVHNAHLGRGVLDDWDCPVCNPDPVVR